MEFREASMPSLWREPWRCGAGMEARDRLRKALEFALRDGKVEATTATRPGLEKLPSRKLMGLGVDRPICSEALSVYFLQDPQC